MRELELYYLEFFFWVLEKTFIMLQESIYVRLITNKSIPKVFIRQICCSPGLRAKLHKGQHPRRAYIIT